MFKMRFGWVQILPASGRLYMGSEIKMMGLILAGVAVVLTLGWTVLVIFANGMSDAPSANGMPVWPGLVIGFTIAAILVAIHYFGM